MVTNFRTVSRVKILFILRRKIVLFLCLGLDTAPSWWRSTPFPLANPATPGFSLSGASAVARPTRKEAAEPMGTAARGPWRASLGPQLYRPAPQPRARGRASRAEVLRRHSGCSLPCCPAAALPECVPPPPSPHGVARELILAKSERNRMCTGWGGRGEK